MIKNFSTAIKKTLIKRFKYLIYTFICKFKIARYLYLYFKLSNLNNKVINKSKPTLAILWLNSFDFLKEDLEKVSKFNYLIFPRIILNVGFDHYLSEFNKTVSDQPFGEYCLDFYRSPKFLKQRNLYIKYSISIIKFLKKKYNVKSFLIPKVNDPWSIDFIKAINETNLKLIIDDREGTNTSKRLKVVPGRLKNLDIKFDLLTTQNYMHRELFIKAGFPKEKIVVNGSLKSDYWRKKNFWLDLEQVDKRLSPNLIKILFFAFGERTYMNFYYENEQRTWSFLSKDINDVFYKILEKYEGKIQLIYKFSEKVHRDTSNHFLEFKETCHKHIDKNFLILIGASTFSYDLMRLSDIIVGFQTSGMIEAMNTERPILYTAWGDLYESIKETLLPIASKDCVIECKSKDQFFEKLSECIDHSLSNKKYSTYLMNSRLDLVNKYFSYSDGLVASRLLKLISKIVD